MGQVRGTFLNRLKYFFGIGMNSPESRWSDYNRYRHAGETFEYEAGLTSHVGRAEWLEKAARAFERAGEADKSVGDFNKSARLYMEHAKYLEGKGKSKEAAKYRTHADRLIEESKKLGGVESKAVAVTSIVGLIGGLVFLSSNITGNVIGSLNQASSNWLGGILFLIGLVGAFAYLKGR